jgi:uncharacterized protein
MWIKHVYQAGFLRALLAASLFVCDLPVMRAQDRPAPKEGKSPKANRLAKESSPYLLQHSHNPVDWFAWGPEAFAKAKTEGKLVFLSIGYSSCHWCHVMERESFDNPDVAKLLNDWFVSIKVDREERPDVDSIYMTALNIQGNRGGWPLSMFLTAEGKPIIGGTYWPPDDRVIDRDTIRGFKSILRIMHQWQTDKPKKVEEQADRLAAATKTALAESIRGTALVALDRSLVDAAVDGLKEDYDREYGGFGSAARRFQGPKFPVPCYLSFLLHDVARSKSAEIGNIVDVTLDRMARGGIYDQLGGGFHRYSTERTWTVPHFEKMLYDNAQLAEVYAQAFQLSRNPLHRRVLVETLAFIDREMMSPEGAFYSALDADSDGKEGLYYVWTPQEIEAAIPEAAGAALFKRVFGVEGKPNFEGTASVLTLPKPLAQIAKERGLTEDQLQARLAGPRQKLLGLRAKRPRPFLDTKILTGWNGQMIAGYATAGRLLGEPTYIAEAARAADFILKNLRTKDGRLLHTYSLAGGKSPEARLNAYLDDYAYLTHGLLCLHEATGEQKWLTEARSLTDTMVKLFSDTESGGFYYTSNDHEKLFARTKDQFDSAQPSGNSVATQNLVRLWGKTGEERYRALAEKQFKTFAGSLKANPTNLIAMADALALYLDVLGQRGK